MNALVAAMTRGSCWPRPRSLGCVVSKSEAQYLKRLGEVIVEVRVLLGITQADLAVLVDRSEAALSRWETGKASPSAVDLWRLWQRLPVPSRWLVDPPESQVTRADLEIERVSEESMGDARRSSRLRPVAHRLPRTPRSPSP